MGPVRPHTLSLCFLICCPLLHCVTSIDKSYLYNILLIRDFIYAVARVPAPGSSSFTFTVPAPGLEAPSLPIPARCTIVIRTLELSHFARTVESHLATGGSDIS